MSLIYIKQNVLLAALSFLMEVGFMSISATKLVKDLALEIPTATNIFEKFGIDYCCGGTKSLQDACASVGVATNEVVDMLDQASQLKNISQEFGDWRKQKLANLVNYILVTHHAYVKTEIPRLTTLLAKVVNKHGINHKELYKVEEKFTLLTQDLNAHMHKEEQVLFPYIISFEEAKEKNFPLPQSCFGKISNPIRVMFSEHDVAGEILRQIRVLTNDYTVPKDACTSFTLLYQGLEAFEKDLHKHVHLENNVLFPRAIELENNE